MSSILQFNSWVSDYGKIRCLGNRWSEFLNNVFQPNIWKKLGEKSNFNPISCNIFYIFKKHYDKIRESKNSQLLLNNLLDVVYSCNCTKTKMHEGQMCSTKPLRLKNFTWKHLTNCSNTCIIQLCVLLDAIFTTICHN